MKEISTNTEIAKAAQQWFARLLAPDCSLAERAAFERWFSADDVHASTYQEVQDIWERSGRLRDRPAIAAALQEAGRPAPRRVRHHWRPALAAAAAVVLAVALAGALWLIRPAQAPMLRYATSVGQQRTLHLKDGSTVVLDTASTLEVRYDKGARNLTLQRGQADFSVRHDAARPFVVHAGDGSVTATGTRFQVRVDDRDTAIVTLLRGQVRVVADSQKPASAVVTLAPDQRVAIESTGALGPLQQVSESELASANGWTEGDLVVKQWPLRRVLAEMNRYSKVKLRLGDPGLGDVPVSGVFKAGDQQSFALSLEYGWPIRAERDSAGNIVLHRK